MGEIEGGPGSALRLTAALLDGSAPSQIGDARYRPRVSRPATMVVEGEIGWVDPDAGRIEVRTSDGGRRILRADDGTRLVYGGVEYILAALEPGDRVRVAVEVDRAGAAWADRIDVRASVGEADSPPEEAAESSTEPSGEPRLSRRERAWLEGTVGRMDPGDAWFTLAVGRESEIVVHVPEELAHEDERRLDRIRRGDRVELEVRPISREEAELVRFL